MKRLRVHQDGFVTMIVIMLAILIAAVIFVFMRVKNAG